MARRDKRWSFIYDFLYLAFILCYNSSGISLVPDSRAMGGKMQLEHYFDFQAPTDIRVKGSRIGIETILVDYLELGLFPEDIVLRYPTLTLEQVYATITYYWHNRVAIDAYLIAWKAHGEAMRQEQVSNPSPAVQRLRKLIQQHRQDADEPDAVAI